MPGHLEGRPQHVHAGHRETRGQAAAGQRGDFQVREASLRTYFSRLVMMYAFGLCALSSGSGIIFFLPRGFFFSGC